MGVREIIILVTGSALVTLFLITKNNIEEKRRLEQEVRLQQRVISRYRQQAELWHSALDEYNKRVKADAVKITAFEKKVEDLDAYIQDLEDRDAICLSDTDTFRLRGLWEEKSPGGNSAAASPC